MIIMVNNKKKVIILSIVIGLIIAVVIYKIWPREVIYGKLDQSITLNKGQLLKLTDVNITIKIVGFDAEACPSGMDTLHECTDVFINLKKSKDSPGTRCSMWEACDGYYYNVGRSNFKTYAEIKIHKTE